MSNIYLTEPATHGKVLLHTSFGDIDIELWGKECPKACRNFVQLAMEGYYDNTVFHRVIRKFMVQGGDPTGTGKGGESIYGKPFRDEIHTRIKFSHRGQVAMANENQPGTNHSQFFFTLDNAAHLDKKHTIFGKITGNTIFNALRMGDIETDKEDRPLEPPRLISVEVLLNPFDDIVPRNLAGAAATASAEAEAAAAAEEKKNRRKRQGKKDFKLLSFGEEADEEEKELDAMAAGRSSRGVKSAHDALDDDKFSKAAAYDTQAVREVAATVATDEELRKAVKSAASGAAGKGSSGGGGGGGRSHGTDGAAGVAAHPAGFDDGESFMHKMRQKMVEKRKALEKSKSPGPAADRPDDDDDAVDFEPEEEEGEEYHDEGKLAGGEGDGAGGAGWGAGDADDDTDKEKARRKAIKARAKEYEALREEMKAKHRAARVMTGEERAKYDAEHMHREMISPVEQMRAKYKKRRKEAGTREDSTMAKLAAFTSTIRTTKKRVKAEDKVEEKAEAYHGQVMEGNLYEGEDDADDGGSWFAGPLKFKRHIDDDLRKGSDGRRADDYAVIDPLKQGGSASGNGAHAGGGGSGNGQSRRYGESKNDGGGSGAGGRDGRNRKREDDRVRGGWEKKNGDTSRSDRRS